MLIILTTNCCVFSRMTDQTILIVILHINYLIIEEATDKNQAVNLTDGKMNTIVTNHANFKCLVQILEPRAPN